MTKVHINHGGMWPADLAMRAGGASPLGKFILDDAETLRAVTLQRHVVREAAKLATSSAYYAPESCRRFAVAMLRDLMTGAAYPALDTDEKAARVGLEVSRYPEPGVAIIKLLKPYLSDAKQDDATVCCISYLKSNRQRRIAVKPRQLGSADCADWRTKVNAICATLSIPLYLMRVRNIGVCAIYHRDNHWYFPRDRIDRTAPLLASSIVADATQEEGAKS